MKKYKFTGETKENIFGATLHRIRAVRDFGDVKAGDLGGWIENEGNLSHDGTAWVYGDARVYGNAQVCGNAWVYGDAWACGNARVYGDARVCGDAQISGDAEIASSNHFLVLGPIGSRNDYTTFFRNKDNGITVVCGCFLGSIDEFLAAVEKTHGDSRHGQAYRTAAELAKIQIDLTEATYEK